MSDLAWTNGKAYPYIIAEAGVNHNGELDLAMQLVDAARQAGADCVKFQAFTATELVARGAPKAHYQETCGTPGESQHDMLVRYELPEADFAKLKRYCDQQKIDFLVTPFSPHWVGVFVNLRVTAFKIGSGNLENIDLIRAITTARLPVIISTGMSDLERVDRAVAVLRQNACGPLACLHCVSLYPTPLEQANLAAIRTLAQHTSCISGFSDHTQETATGAWAVVAGAAILEKHLTLDKHLDGPDHRMSLEPEAFAEYVRLARLARQALGTGKKQPHHQELAVKRIAAMSVVSACPIPAGTKITRAMLTSKRPGDGIPADQIDRVVGCVAAVAIPPDSTIKSGHLSGFSLDHHRTTP